MMARRSRAIPGRILPCAHMRLPWAASAWASGWGLGARRCNSAAWLARWSQYSGVSVITFNVSVPPCAAAPGWHAPAAMMTVQTGSSLRPMSPRFDWRALAVVG